ncbi:2-methoxy-6-polyprenyl-1,4-benzoquinol methylase, mitochondrial [Mycolicibacterium parafortuitum]|uniref:class I SAM-dependent methyltransferase n=1 Tax=Mycolicibacterium parafortuitum TaxID=39692 RepID=UPI0032C4A290
MDHMTQNRPNHHDYLPAAGHDAFLPAYDLLVRALGAHRVYDELIEQADLAGEVLEIGCGTGNVTLRAVRAAPAARITAVDPDPRALGRARRKVGAGRVRFETAYAQRLPFPDASFDRVVSSLMLHHLDEDVKAGALAEARRVLKPGGLLHIADVRGADLPRAVTAAGFETAVLGHRRLRVFGAVTFLRAVRTDSAVRPRPGGRPG